MIDKPWSQYLAEIADIREGIHLHRLGGQELFLEFQKLAVQKFDRLVNELDNEANQIFANSHAEEDKIKAPSATWTYLVNDNPFDNMIGLSAPGNTKIVVDAGIVLPALALFAIWKRVQKKQRTVKS